MTDEAIRKLDAILSLHAAAMREPGAVCFSVEREANGYALTVRGSGRSVVLADAERAQEVAELIDQRLDERHAERMARARRQVDGLVAAMTEANFADQLPKVQDAVRAFIDTPEPSAEACDGRVLLRDTSRDLQEDVRAVFADYCERVRETCLQEMRDMGLTVPA